MPRGARSAGMRRLLILTSAVVALLAGTADRALAHGALKSSEPAQRARLAAVPRVVRLTFNEATELAFTRISLLGPDGREVSLGSVRAESPSSVVADVRGSLVAGLYTVDWQMAGADGHPVRGRFTFTMLADAAGLVAPRDSTVPGEAGAAVPAPGGDAPPPEHHSVPATDGSAFDAESPAYVAVRWATFVGLLIVIGAVAFRWVVLRLLRARASAEQYAAIAGLASPRAAALGLAGAALLCVAVLARLAAQSVAMHGPERAFDGSLISTMLGGTVWGWGWILQAAGAALALAGFAVARRDGRTGWAIAAVAALAVAFTPGLSSHAAASRLAAPAVLADGLHVLGAGGWLGSLLVVVLVGIPVALYRGEAERGPAVADLVSAYSPTALLFAGLLAATGLFSGWLHLDGSLTALWRSDYGRTLLIKLAILSLVAGTGAYNWLRVRPALGDVRGAERIRRSASVELAVGALVLLVTAVLVATPPG